MSRKLLLLDEEILTTDNLLAVTQHICTVLNSHVQQGFFIFDDRNIIHYVENSDSEMTIDSGVCTLETEESTDFFFVLSSTNFAFNRYIENKFTKLQDIHNIKIDALNKNTYTYKFIIEVLKKIKFLISKRNTNTNTLRMFLERTNKNDLQESRIKECLKGSGRHNNGYSLFFLISKDTEREKCSISFYPTRNKDYIIRITGAHMFPIYFDGFKGKNLYSYINDMYNMYNMLDRQYIHHDVISMLASYTRMYANYIDEHWMS